MNEEQLILAEKVRAFCQTLRSSGIALIGQTVFMKVKPNTLMSNEGAAFVVVTNVNGNYTFEIVEDWPGNAYVEIPPEEKDTTDAKKAEHNSGKERNADVP